MVGETLYEVSRNGSLSGSGPRVLDRRLKFVVSDLVVTGSCWGILIGDSFTCPCPTKPNRSCSFYSFSESVTRWGLVFFKISKEMAGAGLCSVYCSRDRLLTAYTVAHYLKLDPGYSPGLLSGSLTESPAIGTASEAIRSLSLPDEQKQLWIGHVAVADAICYIFGPWCYLVLQQSRTEAPSLRSACGVEESGSESGNPTLETWSLFRMATYRLSRVYDS